MPACWYSSVSRGSNIRRKLTLPVWPPVAITMPFLASMAMSRPSAFATMPRTRPLPSRTISRISCLSRICAPFRRALSASRRTSPEPLRFRRGAITSLGTCHSWVTNTRGTVEASGVTIGFSMKVTPLSSRNWKVGTHSSAKVRTRSRSL